MKKMAFLLGWLLVVPLLASPAAAQLTEVTYIIAAPCPLPSFSYLNAALGKGYYTEEGLKVKCVAGKGGVDAIKQAGAGNAEFSQGLGDGPIIVRPEQVPVKIVALLGPNPLHFLIPRKDANIKGPADLKGKKLALTALQDTSFFVTLGVLAKVGLTERDVSILPTGAPGMIAAVATGRADAMLGPLDFGTEVENQGVPVEFIPLGSFFPSMSQAVIVSDTIIRDKPDMVKKFVRASLKGMKLVIENPAEVTKVYTTMFAEQKGRDALLTKIFTRYGQWVYSGQKIPGAVDPERIRIVQDFYFDKGVIRVKSKLDDLFTNKFVEEIAR